MAPKHDSQLEKVIDEVLKSRNAQALDAFWQSNINTEAPIRCSGQFLSKLDTLVCRSLDQKDSKSASLGLAILYKCGKHMKLPGGCNGLSGLIGQGLLEKWFEKCRQLWIQCGPQWDETLYNLSEDFFDALMVVHEACKEGTTKIIESFLYPVGKLAVDPRVYILIQKEAIRKFNLILDKMPVELKKERKILTSQEASDIMMKFASQTLKGGDYDLQTALMEALCRMATADQRMELANQWFSMEYVASAMVKIRDSEFETDCRKFLNLVNGMQGDKRRVYSYPCLEVFLDKHELLMPADEKLEEFWIDFNLESHSISFYFSFSNGEAQEGQWETICINENEVQSYTVTETGKRKVFQLLLSEMMVVGEIEGSSLTIHFSSSLDILQAARTVYGHRKNKDFVGKTSTSVVKTAVRITMKDDISQVVPESQMSLGESEKDTAPYLLPPQSATAQMVTPCKRRLSESTTFISSSAGERGHAAGSFSAVVASKTPAIGKGKPSLEMVRSCDRQDEFDLGEQRTTAKTCSNSPSISTIAAGMSEQSASSLPSMASKQSSKEKVGKHKKNKPLAVVADMVLSGCGEEKSLESSIVPDTQPRLEISLNMSKLSVTEMLTQKIHSLPRPAHRPSLAQQQEAPSSAQRGSPSGSGPTSQKQLHTELTQRLQKVISERKRHPAPQEQFAPRRTESVDIRGDSEGRSSAAQVQCATGLCTPKEQQAQKRGAAKGKSKRLTSPEADAAVMKDPAKTSTSRARKKKVPPIVAVGDDGVLSNREKREPETAVGLVKLISSHYEVSTRSTAKNTAGMIPKSWIPPLVNRPIFNTSWLSTVKKEGSRAVSLMKSYSKTTTDYTRQRKDIFAFNIDAPLSVTGENKTFSNTSATSSSGIHDPPALSSASKKAQPVAKEKRYVKKHLFSDTDYSTTDVSWLRESCRKPKPKVTKYSRQAPDEPRPLSPHTSYESPNLPPASRKPVKGSSKLSKKRPDKKVKAEQQNQAVKAAPDRPLVTGRRPQRAAAISTKSYMEPDTDDSLSESEHPAVSKHPSARDLKTAERTHKAAPVTKKKAAGKQQTESCMRESNHRSIQSTFGQPPTSKTYSVGQQVMAEKTFLEVTEVQRRKNTSAEQSGGSCRRSDSNIQSDVSKLLGLKKQMLENVFSETSKLKKKKVVPAQGQKKGLKDSLAARQTFFSPSPPLIERMRSAERSAPTLGLTSSPLLTPRGSPLPASPDPLYENTPSPILLLPRPRSTASGKENIRPSSFHSAAGGKRSSSKARSNQFEPSLPSLTPIGQTAAPAAPSGPSAAEINPIKQCLSSSPRSPVSLGNQPLLTSTLLEQDKLSMPSPPPSPEDSVNHGSLYGFSKVSSVSWVSSSQSSVLSSRVKTSPTTSLAGSCNKEKTPSSDQGQKSEQLCSGPSRKRHVSSSSNSNEDEKERMKKCRMKKSRMREQRSPRMKPRKLFKSCEVSRVTSSSRSMSSSHWEAEVGEGEMDIDEDFELPEKSLNPSNLCKQFSNELKKKFQSRNNLVEVYNKQSLKTIQQHVSSLNVQVTKYRTQRLEKVQKVLLEEIHKLEQDDAVLKSMEKDLIMYWKKQSLAFHSYQEQGTKRNEALKNTLQSNVCHSVEYEENIFTSQMCMIRNDMKSVQDRLLSEMQEGELQSVKRSLHALFFP